MDQQDRDSDFLKRLRILIASYLESGEPPDAFATHFANLWKDITAAAATGLLEPHIYQGLHREVIVLRHLRNVQPEHAGRIQDLIKAGLSKVADGDKGAA